MEILLGYHEGYRHWLLRRMSFLVTKKEILRDLEDTGFDVKGFEGATKEALTRLLGMVGQ